MAAVKLEEETELWRTEDHYSGKELMQIKEDPELCLKQEPEDLSLKIVTFKSEDDQHKLSVLHHGQTEREGEKTAEGDEEHADNFDTQHSDYYRKEKAPSKRSSALIPADPKPHSCSVCGMSFKFRSRLQRHIVVHSDEKPFKCSVCKKDFKWEWKLKYHMKIHSSTPDSMNDLQPHSCLHCGKRFKWSSALKTHMLNHSDERPHKCSICEKTFKFKHTLRNHTMTHTGEKKHYCPVCKKGFILKNSLSRHLRDQHHNCPVCKKAFMNVFDLKDHLKTHEEDGTVMGWDSSATYRPYSCSDCGKMFKIKSELGRHVVVHSGERNHKCSICEKDFKFKCDLRKHMNIHTGERPCVCAVCGKSFRRTSDLNRHERNVHQKSAFGKKNLKKVFELKKRQTFGGDRTQHPNASFINQPYSCSRYKKFDCESAFQRHMQIHLEERPHRCQVCQKCFTYKYTLNFHMRSHSEKRPHVCTGCKKGFKHKRHLFQHHRHICRLLRTCYRDKTDLLQRVNEKSGTVAYENSAANVERTNGQSSGAEWGKEFVINTHTLDHLGKKISKDMYKSTSEDPYCSICKKGFRGKYGLVRHMKIHTGEKPFKCSVCEKGFSEKYRLQKHKQSHTGERPHVCSVCDTSFSGKHHLYRHLRVQHQLHQAKTDMV